MAVLALVEAGEPLAQCGEPYVECTGAVTYIGTAATAGAPDTVEGSGVAFREGAVAAVEQRDVTATSATVATSGLSVVAEQRDEAAAVGEGRVSGSVAAAGAPDTVRAFTRDRVPEPGNGGGSTNQQGDVLIYQGNDGGEINVDGGIVELSAGLESAAYLSLFGGNEDDDGRAGNPRQWWGNLTENEPERQYRSETQYLLGSLPPIPANLRRIEDAARRDLAWFVSAGAASAVSVSASMPSLNTVRLVVQFTADDTPPALEFIENWKEDAA